MPFSTLQIPHTIAPKSIPRTNELTVPAVCQSYSPAHGADLAASEDESNRFVIVMVEVAVGVGNETALAVAATGIPVVTVPVCVLDVITGIEAVDVVNNELAERLDWRVRQAGSVAQTLAGGSTGPVEACES